ncbi:MAG: phosphoglucosamine mutase [Acidobacteria bacterium]|nr:phosphoglucosamine mutase [Acidobacteriota bacterium]
MKLFGTDGIRGEAGRFPLDGRTVEAVCTAVARRLAGGGGPAVLVARDTRESGPWIRDRARRAFAAAGVATLDLGVLPTPVAARAAARHGCAGALVISASHNPYTDNGLKFLTAEGTKLPDDLEAAVEAEVPGSTAPGDDGGEAPPPAFALDPAVDLAADPETLREYTDFLGRSFPRGTAGRPGLRVVVDCANGAASPLARLASDRFGLSLLAIHDTPDGRNINAGCGAVCPGTAARAVVETGAGLGLSLDGDGDRLMACDAAGRVLDGDALLYVLARWLASRNALPGAAVVGTVMTNLGLERALARDGIRLERTPVGDRHIQARLREQGCALGGEPSGHLIVAPYALTGDGFLAGCLLLEVLADTGEPLPGLLLGYTPCPSRIFNLRVRERKPLAEIDAVGRLEEAVKRLAGEAGRTVIRYSGTEPLLRVLVEAEGLDGILPALEPLLDQIRQS